MRGPFIVFALIGLIGVFMIMKKRQQKPASRFARLRENAEDSLHDLEERSEELRKRAKKVSGEARERLQEQAHELEARQRELRSRLEDLKKEAGRLLERARS
jgi:predicted nuclease with TOPRIM domain